MTENSTWGRYAWHIFHKKATEYPYYPSGYDIKKITCFYYKQFLKYIDCEACQKDYLRIINNYPIKIYSKIDLFMWTIDIHNIVNAKLGKNTISYEQAFQLWNIPHYPPLSTGFGYYNPNYNNRFGSMIYPRFKNCQNNFWQYQI